MEPQREVGAGYTHLGVISIYMVVDAMGIEEVNWEGTESKIRIGSRTETLGKKTVKDRQ